MFDPYHKWLGISPKDQPPNHYRLLALDLFESDPEVIDAAANRQMAYLQQRAIGEYAALSQRLLNEVAAARLCLLNYEKRTAYDSELRRKLEEAKQPAPTFHLPFDDLPAPEDSIPVQPPRVYWSSPLKPLQYGVIVGVILLLCLGGWALFVRRGSPERIAKANVAVQASTDPYPTNLTWPRRQYGLTSLIDLLLIGLVAGWLAGKIVKAQRLRLFGNLAIGVVGAGIGSFLFQLVGLVATGLLGSMIAATAGAIVLLFVLQKIKA